MNFTSVMQNLVIGIVSGIFSSIIVSVVFYLLNEFQTEIEKANDMVYSLYGIVVFGKMYMDTGNIHEFEAINSYFNETADKFSRFEPWKFKGSLHTAMCEIDSILSDGKYFNKEMHISQDMLVEFSQKIDNQLEIIRQCEKNFAVELVKRIFKNKIIVLTLLIFIVIVIVAW